MVVDTIVGGHIVLSPCGLSESKEVKEIDIVIGEEMFHISKGMIDGDFRDYIWELVEWLQKNLIMKREEGVYTDNKGRTIKIEDVLDRKLGSVFPTMWMAMINKNGNHQSSTMIKVPPQIYQSMQEDRFGELVSVRFFRTEGLSKKWLELEMEIRRGR